MGPELTDGGETHETVLKDLARHFNQGIPLAARVLSDEFSEAERSTLHKWTGGCRIFHLNNALGTLLGIHCEDVKSRNICKNEKGVKRSASNAGETHEKLLKKLARHINKALPLAERVMSDEFSDSERKTFREMTIERYPIDHWKIMAGLCGERVRHQLFPHFKSRKFSKLPSGIAISFDDGGQGFKARLVK